MAVPEGYERLGRIGFSDKGNYSPSNTYKIGDVVYNNGSTWVALKDNLKGVTPVEGMNWKYMARGFQAEILSEIKASDNSGLLGSGGLQVDAQKLIDAIADKVATKLLLKTDVVSQIVNDASKAASAAALYSVKQTVDTVNSEKVNIRTLSENAVDCDTIAFEKISDGKYCLHFYKGWSWIGRIG